MQNILKLIEQNKEEFLKDLERLVLIPSISFDGFDPHQLTLAADATVELLKKSGFSNVQKLSVPGAPDAVYGDVLVDPKLLTLLLYAHYDVQPVGDESLWHSSPFIPTQRNGRLFGRGTADDKGGIVVHTSAVSAWLKSGQKLPVNIKMIVEGEEETGSEHLGELLALYKKQLQADVLILTDTSNFAVGVPSITTSLRGLVCVDVEVRTAKHALHSGFWGGFVPDSAMAMSKILSSLVDDKGDIAIAGIHEQVKSLTQAEKDNFAKLDHSQEDVRQLAGALEKVDLWGDKNPYISLWRKPSLVVNALEASTKKEARNIINAEAFARVAIRIVPDMDPDKTLHLLMDHLKKAAPWGVDIDVRPLTCSKWWNTDTTHPAFSSAMEALKEGYQSDPVMMGCGASIPFVAPFARELGGVPALLIGVEDPESNAHAENESLHLADWYKAITSSAILYGKLGQCVRKN